MTDADGTRVRAAVLIAPRRFALQHVDLADPGPGEITVAVDACGICTTNLAAWTDPEHELDRGAAARPGSSGHEVACRVTAVGDGVDHLAPGDAVVVEPLLATACGRCGRCAAGRPWLCRGKGALPVWGFADAMSLPARGALPSPAGVDPALCALAEPLACGVHALRSSWTAAGRGRVDGCRVAVLGAGTLGLLAIVAARHLGAAEVTVLARHEHQADAARSLGADVVILAEGPAARSLLRDARPELVVEAVGGSAGTIELALEAVAAGGEIVVLGVTDTPVSLDARRALLRETRLSFSIAYGSLGGITDFEVALAAIQARAEPLSCLVTHRFPLEEIGEAAATASRRAEGALRVVVEPGRPGADTATPWAPSTTP